MIPFYNDYCDQAFGPGVKLAGYHLQFLGIAPEHQRKGLATQLITAVEKLVGAASGHSRCYLHLMVR